MSQAPAEILAQARGLMIMEYPFWGFLLSEADVAFDSKMPTAYQSYSSTGSVLVRLNPEFFAGLKQPQQISLLIHELRHALGFHIQRRNNRSPLGWNLACDVVVNSDTIIHSHAIPGMITVDTPNLFAQTAMNTLRDQARHGNLLAEDVYELLINNAQVMVAFSKGGKSDFSDQQDLPNHAADENGDPATPASLEAAREKMRQAVTTAQSMSQGNTPGDLGEILKRLQPPQIAWSQQIRHWSSSVLGVGKIQSYRRPPRIDHQQYAAPGRVRSEGKRVLVMIDQSGSVPEKSKEHFFGEIEALEKYAEVWYTVFDVESTPPKRYQKGDWKRIGLTYGGTDVCSAFRMIRKCPVLDGVIVLTDGYTGFPAGREIPPMPVLWAMTTDVTAPFGYHVRLENAN